MEHIGKYRWTICALLFFATTLNYLDRQVLSLLKPALEDKFGWTNSQYADIASVFQFTYAVSLLFAGRFIDRQGIRRGFIWTIIVWSLAAILHAFAIPIGSVLATGLGWIGITAIPVSILGFMVGRVLLAVGESGNFPAAIKTTAEYFPIRERALATGIFNSGANVGAILAPVSVPWIAHTWGWQAAFTIIGSFSLVWLLFWLKFYQPPSAQKRLSASELEYIHSDSNENPAPADGKIRWLHLLQYKQTWAFAFGKFMTDGVWWFFLFWLPAYMKDQYGMAGTDIMFPLAVLYSMTMFGSIYGGWFPIYFIRRGYTMYDSRMRAMLILAAIPLVVLAAQPLGGTNFWIPVLLIGMSCSAHQAWMANLFTTVSDVFPQKAVGSVVGIGGMAGGIGGVIITKAGGALFDHYKALGHIEDGYTIMFAFCAVAYLIAWAVMKLLVPRYRFISDL